ncbi:MAG: hypothetical protein AUG14_03700 [Candidatus Rokubacteria bacterium 13_1_20CM_2_68_19]|nr:MAG: hypothetical protein AUH18_10195 [Candidatus Rokubacteria bacterium 13_2_20CM_69_10]OLB43566.1 MAG: hypothetical protein AUI04_02180 [Candidatus Rokubacteria bacterium 13_2_20CM_2_64_8]OLC60890.1 MAG: hypothetical protein AUH76_11110 [Candidatus Rokubacteria bacterium 13_1_40CM_4_67_11]OLD32776.1 MAG: hypothetical protein AUI49_02115 [Candidatus Rokubacteria bacterium 13_1_40CM_2_68_13]OLE44710.1 MAG: hypothetical protein AUG14_03700 [Candidatus Rokubacteria bacterium 13_1_20CM_2_68_19]
MRPGSARRNTVDIDTELRLVEGLQAGDATALEALMERYSSRLYRLAYGITRSSRDAEEVLQDVFLTVFRKIGSFEGRATLGTWLYRVTTNAALNRRRGLAARAEGALDDQLPTFLPDGQRAGDCSFLLADWSGTPEDELLAGEARNAVNRALAGLPDGYRAVLVLRDVDELSSEETADVLRESVPSVKSRLHRARMALRESITRSLAPRHATA